VGRYKACSIGDCLLVIHVVYAMQYAATRVSCKGKKLTKPRVMELDYGPLRFSAPKTPSQRKIVVNYSVKA